ncbi:MAG TPA: carbohydrate kinase [Parasulfuritortus sp.]
MISGRRPVVFGEVLFDCFPDGSRVLGGAPFNVAWHLRGFGEAPLFVSRVGDDPAGRAVRAAMADWGMDMAGLQVDDRHPTGAVRISLHEGEPRYDIVPDQAYDFVAADRLPAIDRPAFLYHGSLALRSPASRSALIELRGRQGLPVFLDVNLRAPWWTHDELASMLDRATWLKLNADELIELEPGAGNLAARARSLRDRHGLEQVVVTRGGEGAWAVNARLEEVAVRPEAALDVVDTVGAGDAFASVLILGLLHGWPLRNAMRRAQAFASSVVGRRGATVADPGFYRHHLETWRLDR